MRNSTYLMELQYESYDAINYKNIDLRTTFVTIIISIENGVWMKKISSYLWNKG